MRKRCEGWNEKPRQPAGRCAGACARLPVRSGAVGSVRGAAGAIAWRRDGGRVLVDGHFPARTSAALSPPPLERRKEIPGRSPE